MIKNCFIAIVIIFLFTKLTYAQKRTKEKVILSGNVIDNTTKRPLEYATIVFFNKDKNKIATGGITDSKGFFNISILPGVYDISIEYISFKTITLPNIKITKPKHLGLFALEIDTKTLEAVEIIARKTTVEIKLDKKIYNVGKDLTVSGGSASDVLDNVPSVSVDTEGNVALRGNDNVRILINGKPSGLAGLNSSEALKQLPAEAIEKIEVITSPSARYQAEGTAGLLNIILKKNKAKGFNGAITSNIGHPSTAGISGNINYKTGAINIFNTTTFRYTKRLGRWYNDVKYFNVNTPDLDEKRDWTDTKKGITTNTGITWDINNSTSITSSLLYQGNNSNNNSVNKLSLFNKTNKTLKKSTRLDPEQQDDKTIQYTFNFSKNFKKDNHKITFDFQYEDSNENENTLITVDDIESEKVTTLENQTNILLQTDYIIPLRKMGQLEFGYRGDFTTKHTDFEVLFFDTESKTFNVNSNLTSLFNFKQYNTSVYSQFGSKIGLFSYLLGLRIENTKITLDQPTTRHSIQKHINGLFPTVNLNYKLTDTQNLSLSYNRRIRRPRAFMLNPFPSRSSVTNIFQGNPNLNPTFANTFELGYLNKSNTITIASSIYYSHAIEILTFVSRPTGESVTINGEELQVIERGPVNLGSENRYGIELNLNFNPSKKWRINSDFNVFKIERKGLFNDINLNVNNLTWTARLTNKVTLPYKINWQTNINYRGPSRDTQNDKKGIFSTNLAFNKDLFKDNASITLNIRDLFNSAFFSNNITAKTFTAYQEIQFRGGRTFNLAFTYRFNQKKKHKRQGKFDNGLYKQSSD